MTTLFLEPGTDATQDFTFYSATAGTIASNSTTVHTGTRSIQLNTSSPAVTASATTPAGTCQDAGTRISVWYRFDTNVPAGASTFFAVVQAGGAIVARLQQQTSQKINMLATGATTANGNTVLSANTWYRLTVSYVITNSTTYTFKFYINGILESTITSGAGTLTNITSNKLILESGTAAGTNSSTYWDDVYIDNGSGADDPGDVRVTAKRPFANGTTNGFTATGTPTGGIGTGNAPYVSQLPLDTTAFVSIVASSATTEEYNIESQSAGIVNISKNVIVDYMGWLFYKTVLTENPSIIVNGVNTSFSSTVNTNTFQMKIAGSTTYPSGTGTDIGIITDTTATTVSLFECGIVIAYRPINGDLLLVLT